MNKPRFHKRSALLAFALVIGLPCVVCFVWVRKEQRQYALDRQLIETLKQSDTKKAMALLEAGADPNTREAPSYAPTLPEIIDRLFHPARSAFNDSPTTFMMACGRCYERTSSDFSSLPICKEDLSLLQAMLQHGANVLAHSGNKLTAMHGAAELQRWRTIDLLLQHGANVNVQDAEGISPLMIACNQVDTTAAGAHLLLRYGADPNLKNRVGRTALFFAVVWPPANCTIPDLLAHGADPNLPDIDKLSPIQRAEKMNLPDLVALLRKYSKHP